jgi:hypothetical protein
MKSNMRQSWFEFPSISNGIGQSVPNSEIFDVRIVHYSTAKQNISTSFYQHWSE